MLWAAPAKTRGAWPAGARSPAPPRCGRASRAALQLHAQCQRAARGALRQALEPGHRGVGLAVLQRPARGAHQRALVRLLGVARRRLLQRLPAGVPRARPCPAAPARSRPPAGAPACAPAPPWPARSPAAAQRFLLHQRRLGRLAGADEAAGQQVRDRVQQRAVHGALLLLRAPAQRLARQVEQRRQRAQRGMQEDEGAEQQQQHQVERQVHAVRRPEHRDRALVVAREQRDGDGDAEQGQEPEGGAHQRPPCKRTSRGRAECSAAPSRRRGGQHRQRFVDARQFDRRAAGSAPAAAGRPRPGSCAPTGSKYLRKAAVAAATSARADSVCRDSSASRALSSLSLRFSRRKKACSGASSTASGWSMRLTRTSPRASSRMSRQGALPPRERRCRLLLAGGPPTAAGAGHRIGQRQLVDLPRQLVQPGQQAGHVGHAGRLDAVDVARDGGAHAGQPRLPRTLQALVGAAQRRQQRLDAAGQLRLLLRQAQGRLDVDHQVLVARTRQALHQLFELRALQRHFAEPGLRHGLACGGFPRQLLRLPRQGARLDGIGCPRRRSAAPAVPGCSRASARACRWTPATSAATASEQHTATPRGTAAPLAGRRRRLRPPAGKLRCGRPGVGDGVGVEDSELIETILGPPPRRPRTVVTRKQHRSPPAAPPARCAGAWPRRGPAPSPAPAAGAQVGDRLANC